jgi:hypothetical protein
MALVCKLSGKLTTSENTKLSAGQFLLFYAHEVQCLSTSEC